MDKFNLLKSHVNAYTKKDGTVVQAHDYKFRYKDANWASGGKTIPASDIPEKAPTFSHQDVYGRDGKKSPTGTNFHSDFAAKAPQHFVITPRLMTPQRVLPTKLAHRR